MGRTADADGRGADPPGQSRQGDPGSRRAGRVAGSLRLDLLPRIWRDSSRTLNSRRGAWALKDGGDSRAVPKQISQPSSCAGMRWSAPELGTNLGTNSEREKFLDGQLFEMNGGLGRD